MANGCLSAVTYLPPIVAVLASPLSTHLADEVIALLLVASPLRHRSSSNHLLSPLNLPLQQLEGRGVG